MQKHYQNLLAKGYTKQELISIVARNREIYAIMERNSSQEDAVSIFK